MTATRLLAVTAEPPEAAPGAQVALRAWVASPDGPVADAGVRWVRCDVPPAFGASQALAPACLEALEAAARDAGAPAGPTATVALPGDDCGRFGPDAPSAGLRPRDPDATGGYSHPVGVALPGDAPAFAALRLTCRPAGVSFEVAQAWAAAARPNTNPQVEVSAAVGGAAAGWLALPAGAEVALAADWSATPEEAYALVLPGTLALGEAVERYDVAWYVTAGTLDRARSASGQGRWRLPAEAGQGTLWAVVRDSRGGVGVAVREARWR